MTTTDRIPTHDVRLREVVEADLLVFFEHQRDPVATAMAAFPSRDREIFLAHWAKIDADPACTARTVVADGVVVGNIGSFDREGVREVGYWIGREHWGRGIATQAVTAFLDVERVRPLHAGVVKHNAGSLRVLEKCGFVRSGVADDYILLQLNA